MKKHYKDVQIFEEALIRAHRSASPAEPGPFFQKKVMARILEERTFMQAPVPSGLNIGSLVWRLALLSNLAVTALTALLMNAGFDSQYQISMFILGDSSSMDLLHTFGVM